MPEPTEPLAPLLASSAESIAPAINEDLAFSVRSLLIAGQGRIRRSEVLKAVYGAKVIEKELFSAFRRDMDVLIQAGLVSFVPPNEYIDPAAVPPAQNDNVAAAPIRRTRPKPSPKPIKGLDEMLDDAGISGSQFHNSSRRSNRQRPVIKRSHRR